MKRTYIVKANSPAEAMKKVKRMQRDGDFDIGNRAKLNGAVSDCKKCIEYIIKTRDDIQDTGDNNSRTYRKADRIYGELTELLEMLKSDKRYQSYYGDKKRD